MAFNDLQRFKRAIKSGETPARMVLRKPMLAAIEPMDNRRIRYTISSERVDRDRDTVALNGWELTAFNANPVVLWAHDAKSLPVGRAVDVFTADDTLKAVVEFVPADMPEVGDLAEAIVRMSRTGFLSATSVGFLPSEFEVAKDRDDRESWFPPVNFLKQELMEFSIVSIPANVDALIDPDERMMAAATLIESPHGELGVSRGQIVEDDPDEAVRIMRVMADRKQRQLDSRLIDIGR